MQNHNDDTIWTSNKVLLKNIPLTLLKGLCVRGSWRPNRTATYWPRLLWPSAFLSNSPGLLNQGTWGPSVSGCWFSLPHLISNCNCSTGGLRAHSAECWLSLQHLVSLTRLIPNWLNFLCTEFYNSSTPTFFLWASQLALIQPVHGQGYILIFLDRMHLLFTQVHFLFWRAGWVVGQYTTSLSHIFYIYLNTNKQMNDVKLLLLHSNTQYHIILWKILSIKCTNIYI